MLPYAGLAGYPYAAYPYALPVVKPLTLSTEVTATNLPVPVSVGGYKAEAGDNGDLKGAVHGKKKWRIIEYEATSLHPTFRGSGTVARPRSLQAGKL